ncbi:MAG: lycopene cyclase domain-containing protein [Dermatophilaceae bacterium]
MSDSWRHASYALMLALVLLAVLPLHHFYRLRTLRQPVRLLKAIVPVAALFATWDIAAAATGQWRFDPAQTFPARLWGLPLEEYAFFVVIPFAAILTFEAVAAARFRRHTP